MTSVNPGTTLIASGTISGLLELTAPVRTGPLWLTPEQDHIGFIVELDVAGKTPAECSELIDRIQPAVQAAVVAATGTAVRAHLVEWSYPNGDLDRIGKQLRSDWSIRAGWPEGLEPISSAQDAFAAITLGADDQLADLYKVYLLGVEAVQTIAPLVGLWAFSTVVETASPHPPPNTNVAHLSDLDSYLRSKKYDLPPAPSRRPSRVRAAALHPTLEPAPTLEPVDWFRELARAYLRHRAETGFRTLPLPAANV